MRSFIEQEMKQLSNYRSRFLRDVMHKLSSYIINYCLEHYIGNLAVGYNVGWKQRAKLGRKNTQNFQYIPFHKLLKMLAYKCKLVGINYKRVSERHTSKRSALDFESIEHHDKYLGRRRPPIKGRKGRKELKKGVMQIKKYNPRGLFRSAKGYIIHSDVNGSFNIGRVAYPELCNQHTLTIENMLLNPSMVEVTL